MGGQRSRLRRPATPGLLVVATVALAIGVLASALAPRVAAIHGRRKPAQALTAPHRAVTHAPQRAFPVSATELTQARAVAVAFIDSYLPVADGRAPASSVTGSTTELRQELVRARAWVTPAERTCHPRLVSVQAQGQTPRFVLVTAAIGACGITSYPLAITVVEGQRRWLVSNVVDG
jgi:hypothetical protein